MKIVATAFSLLLMCSVDSAYAAPITFEVEYTTLFRQRCFTNGACVLGPTDPFTRTFTLDSAQLMVDGVYDVAASLDPIPTVTPPGEGIVTTTLNANAIVADEQVIDLVMGFLETVDDPSACEGFGLRRSSLFTQSSGIWSSEVSRQSTLSDFCSPNSNTANGTYTVQQLPEVPVAVPEPASLLLVLGGGLFARLRTRQRVH